DGHGLALAEGPAPRAPLAEAPDRGGARSRRHGNDSYGHDRAQVSRGRLGHALGNGRVDRGLLRGPKTLPRRPAPPTDDRRGPSRPSTPGDGGPEDAVAERTDRRHAGRIVRRARGAHVSLDPPAVSRAIQG